MRSRHHSTNAICYFSLLLVFQVGLVTCQLGQFDFNGTFTKDVIDFCWPSEPDSCGPKGECIKQPTGNRCTCPDGQMGRACLRPCQDIYKSCERWLIEKRCEWAKPISPFFFDNCPLSCGICRGGKRRLRTPLPPVLEPLSWIIGRWATRTSSVGSRFPLSLPGAYKEILDFAITDVPSFDRPPLKVSVIATSMTDPQLKHVEAGFMTVKPFNEDTGFVVKNKPLHGDDLVAIEMVSNNGLITIEEGTLHPRLVKFSVRHKFVPFADIQGLVFREANRTFELKTDKILEEHTKIVTASGEIIKFRKKYVKIFDYLSDYVANV